MLNKVNSAYSSSLMVVGTISKITTKRKDHAISKFVLLIVLFCISTLRLSAQDIITKKDGTEIQAKVFEIGTNEVKYTRFGTTSPTYTLLKSEIFMIKYENGTKDVFNDESTQVSNTNPGIYKYTFGNPINPVGGSKSAWGSGIASFFIPGLGQFINGDIGGGFLYLGCNMVCNYVWLSSIQTDGYNVSVDQTTFTIGFLSALVVNIASIVNAAQIAKRVNLARGYQLANNTYLQIQPTIIPQNNLFTNRDYAYGMNFKVNF